MQLGYGSWNVVFSKSGYESLTFTTPNELAGAYMFDAYLVPNGSSKTNCTSSTSSTNSSVYTTDATTVAAGSTTVAASQPVNNQSAIVQLKSYSRYALFEIGSVLFVIVVVIIVLAAYFVPKIKEKLKQKPKPKTGTGSGPRGPVP